MRFYKHAILALLSMVFTFSGDFWISPDIFNLPKELFTKERKKIKTFWSQKKEAQLQKVHLRLFEMFFPYKNLDLTPKQKKITAKIKKRIWQFIVNNEQAQYGLMFFLTIPGIHWRSPQGAMKSYYKLLHSPIPHIPKLAKQFRYLYLLHIYGSELGKDLSNYRAKALPIIHPHLNKHTEYFHKNIITKLDRESLYYDKEKKQLKHNKGEFDYLIVGSGTSGSVLAHELRKNGKRVVVVERGSFSIPGALDCVRIDQFKEKANIRTSLDGGIVIRNANVVGGGSAVNIDLAFAPTLPTVQSKIDLWRDKNYIREDQLTPQKVEKAYEWVKSHIGTRALKPKEINGNNQILWHGSKKMGWEPSLYDLNRYQHGNAIYPVTDKVSSVEKLLLPALSDNENPLYLLSDSEVQKIIYDQEKKQAYGVSVKKLSPWYKQGVVTDLHNMQIPTHEVFHIYAKKIILCAGSLGSANILLRSKYPNTSIGKGVVLHPSMPIIGIFDRKIDAASGLTASVYNDYFALSEGFILEAMSAGPEYVALMTQGSGKTIAETVRKYSHLGGFGVMVVDGSTRSNRVIVDKNGKTQIVYYLTDADKAKFRRGLKRGIAIIFAAGAKKVALPSAEILNPTTTFFENVQDATKAIDKMMFDPDQTIVTSAHMQGTNKMGKDPKRSVVDTDYKLWGMKNVYVVDGSVFPTSVGANPMQAIYTTAKIFADKMNE